MSNVINLTVATDINGKGGIATVLTIYSKSGFFNRHNVRLVSTHADIGAFGILSGSFLYVCALFKIVGYLLFCKVGLVHIHMASRGSYLRKSIVIRLIKVFGGKVILHLHGAEFRDFYANECNAKKQRHIRCTFEKSDAVVVLSSQFIEWAKETLAYSNHVCVIYNASIKLDLDRSMMQSGLIVFLGRVGNRKGALDLIRAFAKVKRVCPEATLKFGGDGEIEAFQEEVKKRGLGGSVEFLGWISGSVKEELLSKADIYCLPSYNEGFPMGVLEAMSAEVAVVSTWAGGIPDAITDQQDGLLVGAGDVDALADALIDVIKDRNLNKRLVESARAKFLACFSVEAVMPQLDALYLKLLEEAT
jgi:glycosyltransferase involved in cell wall biosynthesis